MSWFQMQPEAAVPEQTHTPSANKHTSTANICCAFIYIFKASFGADASGGARVSRAWSWGAGLGPGSYLGIQLLFLCGAAAAAAGRGRFIPSSTPEQMLAQLLMLLTDPF